MFSKLNSDDKDNVTKTNLNVEKAYIGGMCSVGRLMLLKCQFYNTSQNILNANYKTQCITKYYTRNQAIILKSNASLLSEKRPELGSAASSVGNYLK